MDYSKQERGNKMKLKALFVFFFGMVLSLIIVDIGLAKVIKTPTIEGKVIDADNMIGYKKASSYG